MLNWKELELILSELSLKGSFIQKTTEHSTHAFTLSLYNNDEKAWLMYFEIGTKESRVNRTNRIREKTKVVQRFGQYLRSHLVGKRITSVEQLPYDRAFLLRLESPNEKIMMLTRLFSGSKANIFILSEDSMILEAMYRRKTEGERIGDRVFIERRDSEGDRHYEVREWDKSTSFNDFIDRNEEKSSTENRVDALKATLEKKMDKELSALEASLSSIEKRIEKTSRFDQILIEANLLKMNLSVVQKGMDHIELNGTLILLDKRLDAAGNLEKLYSQYKRDKKTYEMALSERDSVKERLERRREYYSRLIENETSYKVLERAKNEDKREEKDYPGVRIVSHGSEIYIGRNANENDEILRRIAKSWDIWIHTRDWQGGYVIIKRRKDKSVPLEVLLDGAMAAIFFSKGRKAKSADLYYTEVKYLKRVKDAKKGLIIPTREKNLRATLDEERIKELLEKGYDESQIQ